MSVVPLLWQFITHKINEISSLQTGEFVAMVATYNLYLLGPTIEPEIYTRGYTAAQLEAVEAAQAAKFSAITSMGLVFERPLEKFPCSNMQYVLQLFKQYEAGNLPFPGSVSEQPAQIIEIFNTLAALKRESDDKARSKNG